MFYQENKHFLFQSSKNKQKKGKVGKTKIGKVVVVNTQKNYLLFTHIIQGGETAGGTVLTKGCSRICG